ncbi:hypothetical protein QT970_27740 [Microcoleus sp. herbarium8]|uniref:hypothetical protein n=1 Tax=Microcoleus sp. herbarium8 TaxID=3055436 RepID=UPI002FD3FFB8
MSSSDNYKSQIMKDLAQGNKEVMPETTGEEYENFDDFAQRTSPDQRKQLFGRSLNHDSLPPTQLEPELQKAIAQIKPKELDDVAREFLKQLDKRGLNDRQLEKQLGLSTHHASRMNADDVTKLASFTYHNHPDIFRDVLAQEPGLMKFLGNPVVVGILGIVAAKWLNNRK